MLLFGTEDADGTHRLWRTDGTGAGTEQVADLELAFRLGEAGGVAYLSVVGEGRVRRLWRTDGTPGGTVPVVGPGGGDVPPGDAAFTLGRGTVLGDRLIFAGTAPDGTYGLWSTDGTPGGTTLLNDEIYVSEPSGLPNDYYTGFFVSTDDAAWFVARSTDEDDVVGTEVWVTDGTADGTRPVDLAPGRGRAVTATVSAAGALFAAVNQDNTVPGGGSRLWTSDGTPDGTEPVGDPDEDPAAPGPTELVAFTLGGEDDGVLFAAKNGSELWHATTDAETLVTELGDEVDPGTATRLHVVDDLVYFRGDVSPDGATAWRTDGTANGTFSVGGSSPFRFFGVGDNALFFSRENANYRHLWASDGTAASTGEIKDLTPPVGQTAVGVPVLVDGTLWFAANGDAGGSELWSSDGTTAGTTVTDLVPGSFSSAPDALLAAGDRLWFNARAAGGDRHLYVRESNGTIRSVWTVEGAGSTLARPVPRLALGDDVLFTADDGESGAELWVSDGTAEGTRLVRDIWPGEPGSDPADFAPAGDGRALFSAIDGARGRELWTTDGTAEGTASVADFVPGPAGSNPTVAVLLDDDAYVVTDRPDGSPASDLWRVPLDLLDDLEPPEPVGDLEPLPTMDVPSPLREFQPPDPPDPPDPPLALDVHKLRVRLNTKRESRDRLHLRLRLPIGCAADGLDGLALSIDVGGLPIDVTLDHRGRATAGNGATVRARIVKPKRRKDEPTEVRIDVRLRRADLSGSLSDDLVIASGLTRGDGRVDVTATWCESDYARSTAVSIRRRARRGTTTATLDSP